MDDPIDLKAMLLQLEYQVLEDVNGILCPHTLDIYRKVKTQIISVLENGVEDVEVVERCRGMFEFWIMGLVGDDVWQSKKEGHAVEEAVEEAVPCERDSLHRM